MDYKDWLAKWTIKTGWLNGLFYFERGVLSKYWVPFY